MTRRAGEAILVAICAAYAVFCVATRPAGPLTSPDSAVYLAFSPVVPAGYPAFLRAIGERGAVVAQPLIYAAALAALGIETLAATASLLLAAAVVVASIAVPEIRMYHASIQTESLHVGPAQFPGRSHPIRAHVITQLSRAGCDAPGTRDHAADHRLRVPPRC